MREEGGHHYLCLGREVQVARVRVWDDERVVARGARDERGGREDAERLFEDGMYCIAISVGKVCVWYIDDVKRTVSHRFEICVGGGAGRPKRLEDFFP